MAIHHTITYYNQGRIHTTFRMPPAKYRMLHEEKVLEKVVEKMST